MKFILIHDLLLEFLFLSPQLIEFVTVCERETERSMLASKSISTQEVIFITGKQLQKMNKNEGKIMVMSHMYCLCSTWNRSLLSMVCSSRVRFCSMRVWI